MSMLPHPKVKMPDEVVDNEDEDVDVDVDVDVDNEMTRLLPVLLLPPNITWHVISCVYDIKDFGVDSVTIKPSLCLPII